VDAQIVYGTLRLSRVHVKRLDCQRMPDGCACMPCRLAKRKGLPGIMACVSEVPYTPQSSGGL
jgi:hypothetical protein